MAIPGTVTLTAVVAPTSSGDTYPVIDPKYGIDGLRNVSTNTERNAIPNDRRKQGMIVGVDSTGSTKTNYWTLLPNPWSGTDADWIPFAGTSGSTFDVYVTGGTYSSSAGTATFTNNTGGTFSVTGFTTGSTKKYVITTGFTASVINTITHNLNTEDIIVQIWDSNKQLQLGGDIKINSGNSTTKVDIVLSVSDTYKIVIIG